MTKRKESTKLKPWTKEEDETLKTMWIEGKHAATIALTLGRPSDKSIWHRVKALKLKRPIKFKHLISQNYKELTKGQKQEKQPLKTYHPIEGNGVSVLEIRDGQCRWPVEGRLLACGCECNEIYCAAHIKIAFQAVKKAA